MSRDFKEIFDLARLRRAWGDASAAPPAPAAIEDEALIEVRPKERPSDGRSAQQASLAPVSPLAVLDQLAEAIAQEFPTHAAALGYHVDLLRSRLKSLVGEGGQSNGNGNGNGTTAAIELPAELAFAYHADVQENLDQLEDLIDALSLPARSGD